MSLGINSCGFGHRPFSKGPFGSGPWVAFPFRPDFTHAEELSYAVAITRFEDASEQRALLSQERGLTLGYEFTRTDSGIANAVQDFYMDAGGPACRFLATDHRTGIPYVVRFADQALAQARGRAMARSLPPFSLRVDRYVTYAEEVAADGPLAYWRCDDSSGSVSLADWTGNGNAATPINPTLPATGLLTGDDDGALDFTTLGGALLTSQPVDVSARNPFTFEAIIAAGAADGARRALLACEQATFLDGAGLHWRAGAFDFTRGDASSFDTLRSMPVLLATPTHAAATYDGATMRLYVDGALVAEGTSTRSANPSALFFSLGCDQNGVTAYSGLVDEMSVYSGALAADRIRAHAQAMTRP